MSEQHLLDSSGNTQNNFLYHASQINGLSSSLARSKSHIFQTEGLRASDLSAPGELRRHYLHSNAEELGIPEEERPKSWKTPFLASIGRLSVIEYLEVGNRPEHVYRKKNGVVRTYFTLVKSMIGTGILFIPRGFYLGGWLMSTLIFCVMSAICTICMLWLSDARSRYHDTLGGLAERAIGPLGKHIVDLSVFLTQVGFSIVGVVFINSNLLKVLEYFGYYGEWWLPVAIQFMIYIPLCLKKHLSDLAITHIIAVLIILSNVAYLEYKAVGELESPVPDIEYISFNSDTFMLMFGMAVYCFEGVGLVLPIREAMKEPEKFDRVLIAMMITITFLLISFGLLNYFAYGQYIAQMVTLNIETSLTSVLSQISYLLAIILSYPLMLFPPFQIIEYKLGRDKAKRYSDFLKIMIVTITLAVAVILKEKADKYIALLGALLCSPLAYIVPSIIRLKLKPKISGLDTIYAWSFIALGVIGSTVTLIITIKNW